MRIAQIAPLYERVPPLYYGGTERIVSYLTEELINQGHELTLFASGDSTTKARLIAPCKRSLRLDAAREDPLVYHLLQLEQVFQNAASFDILHFHVDYWHYPFSRRVEVPQVTTLHGRLDLPDLVPLYREFADVPVISISDSQRASLPWINWQGTVYHGIPQDSYTFNKNQGSYLAFVGRISREKRVDRAIEIAKLAGMKLKIAAKVDAADRHYMDTEIRPLLDHPLIEFLGEIGEKQKADFLGNAYALLFPIDWVEPFGLVMIEAMACGTPVIAFRRGSVPEIIDDEVTGFIVESIEDSLRALEKVEHFDRSRCRSWFEKRYSAARMAADYVKIYERLIKTKVRARPKRPAEAARIHRPSLGTPVNGEAGHAGTLQSKPR
ncbi:MAG TPA: glycosyltransferase family 4 protein [Candidatus Binatia bacterium]|jgi:glycosyltransferase involved in cell wall biosynthesis|nr:glycosyltransferase family 4 protein [Candidatus Binatia bacterium]